jgi:FkbM family methyltransferase
LRLRRLLSTVLRKRGGAGVVNFGHFQLAIDLADPGGVQYRDMSYWVDLGSPLEHEVVRRFRPDLFVDVGANYGFTALLHHQLNPEARIVAVEPSPHVAAYLRRNLDSNGCSTAQAIEGVCSDHDGRSSFAVNPDSSQDSRVIGQKGWRTITQRSVSLSTLLETARPERFAYIKIDTQGHEQQVIRGGARFLDAHSNWLIKAEFAPKWLRSQGTDPAALLLWLVQKYQVIELPKRIRFRGDSLHRLAEECLEAGDAATFPAYIEGLARGDGWCDLFIAPRTLALRIP